MDELKKCQDNLGTGFIFGAQVQDPNNVERQFNIVEGKDRGNTWVPWYTMHKIMAGLLDLYKFADDPDALEVAKNLGNLDLQQSKQVGQRNTAEDFLDRVRRNE